MKFIIILISMILDLLILNVFNFSITNIPYFYPMFTITSIVYISNLYTYAFRKNYYLLVIITSIIYDCFAVGNLLLSVPAFMVVAFINMEIKKRFSNNLFNNIISVITSIIIYDLTFHLLLVSVNYQSIDFYMLFYKITHSLIINIIYIVIMFLVLKNKKA